MTLLWALIFGILIFEITLIVLLCIPHNGFQNICTKLFQFCWSFKYIKIAICMLFILICFHLCESIFEIYKLTTRNESIVETTILNSHVSDNYHMRLFRAQRNLYLSTGTLLFNIVIVQFYKLRSEIISLIFTNQKKIQ